MGYILIIDDDIDLADATAMVLRTDGHEVGICFDIESAFESFKNRCPDLVILDVMFPGNASGGFNMARRIAAVTKQVPILMLTAINSHFQLNFSASDIEESWLPITEFLEKPVNFTELGKMAKELIEKKNRSFAKKGD
jgi:DNA-binding response OmpR family regulator